MKAVAVTRKLPIDDPELFSNVELPDPEPGPRDLRVRVKAVAINPLDYKVRQSRKEDETTPKILGWDASGIIEAVGEEVTLFRVGEEVYYAGDITRAGSNAELQLVDERVHVYALKTGFSNIELYSPKTFEAKYGIKVDQFLDFKSLKQVPVAPGRLIVMKIG